MELEVNFVWIFFVLLCVDIIILPFLNQSFIILDNLPLSLFPLNNCHFKGHKKEQLACC